MATTPIKITQVSTASFDPRTIGSCQLWLDAADLSTFTFSSGTNVTAWQNKGLGTSATANTAIVYNANGLGTGFPALTFTSSQWLNGTLTVTGTTMTVFSIFSMNSSSPFAARILALAANEVNDFNNTGYVGILRQSSTNMGPYRNGTYTQAVTPYSTRLMNTTYFDGTNQYTTTNGGTFTSNASSGSFAISAYRVANNTNSGDSAAAALNGFIGEILVYSFSLTTTQRQQIEGYLAQKWGLSASLPETHPFRNGFVFSSSSSSAIVRIKNGAFPLFNPRLISGCQLWLDAADTTTTSFSGSSLSQWTDKSSTGKTITITGTLTQTTNGRNGLQTLTTNGGYVSTSLSSAIGNGDYALIAVWYQSVAGTNGVVGAGINTNGNGAGIGVSGLVGGLFKYNFYQFGVGESSYQISGPTFLIQEGIRIGGTNTNYINGDAGTASTNSLNLTNTTLTVGAATSFPMSGQICEALVYVGTLMTPDREKIEGYLAHKWGLQGNLPSNHPHSQVPPNTFNVRAPVKVTGIRSAAILTTVEFSYIGANQTFSVPSGITSIHVYLWGAGGGSGGTDTSVTGGGGAGAMVQGVLTVTPGESLTIIVGSGGFGSGTSTVFGGGGRGTAVGGGTAGSGGGRSEIGRSGTTLVIAGGGGGGSWQGTQGGAATFTGTGSNGSGGSAGGKGGTQLAGGAAGTGSVFGTAATAGSLSQGGTPSGFGGGGGGGYYGGGGASSDIGAGGGGGSSFISNLTLIPGESVLGFTSSDSLQAPNTTSPYYSATVGRGGSKTGVSSTSGIAGGHGRVVIRY